MVFGHVEQPFAESRSPKRERRQPDLLPYKDIFIETGIDIEDE